MSGPRCEEVFSGAVGAEAMPGPLGGGLWRQGCAERHGGGTRQNDRGQKWTDDAERIRSLILEKLWCEEDASFYDVAPDGSFVRIRSVANCRVLGEHVLRPNVPNERKKSSKRCGCGNCTIPRHTGRGTRCPALRWTTQSFVRPIPRNSWGGASQALTALRTLRWMEYYGKARELRLLMERWSEAIVRAGGFCQQMDPETGVFTQPDPGGYSPCALVFLHFAKRLGRGA